MLQLVGEYGEELVLLQVGRLHTLQFVLLFGAALAFLGEVAGDLGEADDLARTIHQWIEQAAEEAPTAIAAGVPALVRGLAMLQCALALGFRNTGLAILLGVDDVHRLAEHFGFAVTQDQLGTAVPGSDQAVTVQGDDGVALGALRQQLEVGFAGA